MSSRQEAVRTILELLRQKYEVTGEDEFGANFKSKDGSHTVHMAHSTITFQSATNALNTYSFGYGHLPGIRRMISSPPSFSDAAFEEKRQEVEKKKPYWQREKKPAGEPKGPSIRSMIFEGLAANKDQDTIIVDLKKAFPDKEESILKARFYGHRSEWNKKKTETK